MTITKLSKVKLIFADGSYTIVDNPIDVHRYDFEYWEYV